VLPSLASEARTPPTSARIRRNVQSWSGRQARRAPAIPFGILAIAWITIERAPGGTTKGTSATANAVPSGRTVKSSQTSVDGPTTAPPVEL